LLAAGVEEILIWEGHGAGGIVFEEPHPATRTIPRTAAPSTSEKELAKHYDPQ
jgi:hypothetical protein